MSIVVLNGSTKLYLLVGFDGVSHADRGSVLNSCCGIREAKYVEEMRNEHLSGQMSKNARITLAYFRHLSGHLSWAIIADNCPPNATPLCTNFPPSQKHPTTKPDRYPYDFSLLHITITKSTSRKYRHRNICRTAQRLLAPNSRVSGPHSREIPFNITQWLSAYLNRKLHAVFRLPDTWGALTAIRIVVLPRYGVW